MASRKLISSSRSHFVGCDVAICKKDTTYFSFKKMAFCDE